jgi:hypothetical protein
LIELATDDMLTIEPPPASSMAGRKARIIRYWAVTLRSVENAQARSSQSRIVPAVDHPGAVEQHVDRAELGRQGQDRLGIQHVERARLAALDLGQQVGVDVGGDDPGAFAGEQLGAGLADALGRRGHQGGLAVKSVSHLNAL